jgi:hypothetical protein
MVPPHRTTTDPEACFANFPVSMEITFPQISASTFVCIFSPDVQHQGTTLRQYSDWIIHQPRMLFFIRWPSTTKSSARSGNSGTG